MAKNAILTGLLGRCPRCGQASMFDGFLKIRSACPACGLDYSFQDAGDGPAVFVMFIVGFLAVGLGLWLEVAYQPPVWVHLAVLTPVVIFVSLGLLRPLKGILVALQYRHDAAEGRLVEEPSAGGHARVDRNGAEADRPHR